MSSHFRQLMSSMGQKVFQLFFVGIVTVKLDKFVEFEKLFARKFTLDIIKHRKKNCGAVNGYKR